MILLHKVRFFLIISNFKRSDFTLLQEVAMLDYHLIKMLNSSHLVLPLLSLLWVTSWLHNTGLITLSLKVFFQVLCMITNILFSWFSNSLFIPCSL
jgi:hypothetical protein